MPRKLPPLSAVLESIARAHQMVSDLCNRRREWIMSIPVRLDYDPDVVIATGLQAAKEALLAFHTLRPVSEYHEDYGTVLWWRVPIEQPPWVGGGPGDGAKYRDGTPTECQLAHDCGWPTHWSPLPDDNALEVR